MRRLGPRKAESGWLGSLPHDSVGPPPHGLARGRLSDPRLPAGATLNRGGNAANTGYSLRDLTAYFYPDRKWLTAFVGGSYEFLDGAERLLDARAMFFHYATVITPR